MQNVFTTTRMEQERILYYDAQQTEVQVTSSATQMEGGFDAVGLRLTKADHIALAML
jgi:hypothetical protein